MSDIHDKPIKDGQQYYDEPKYAWRKRDAGAMSVELALASMETIGTSRPRSVLELVRPVTRADLWKPIPPIVLGYEKVRLRWLKPDGKGGLVPR